MNRPTDIRNRCIANPLYTRFYCKLFQLFHKTEKELVISSVCIPGRRRPPLVSREKNPFIR